jgi:two-component system, NtrC family, nitrogen regulation response regulator NtrX
MIERILVVDDEPSIRTTLRGVLEDEGYEVEAAPDGRTALALLSESAFDLVLLDVWMPGMDGLETVQEIRRRQPAQRVVMMSGHGTIETAVRATKLGAYDFVEKPLNLDKLIIVLRNALEATKLSEENRSLRQAIGGRWDLVGESPAIQALRDIVGRAAATNAWVLVTGENGTGKELVARALHRMSARSAHPFIAVNCAAIPEELIESELFGYEKGAFTGANTQKLGRFDQADGGTLFLDEIADMSMKTQAKILRILQERSFERVGGTKAIKVDVRVVAATNKNLAVEIAEGRFREDLFYRINVIPIQLPPLRERGDDISRFVKHFTTLYALETGKLEKTFTGAAMGRLEAYAWPGNVRELRNLVERLMVLGPDVIDAIDLPTEIQAAGKRRFRNDASLQEAREEFEREFLLEKLEENEQNISRTAESINMSRENLSRRLKALGIVPQKR